MAFIDRVNVQFGSRIVTNITVFITLLAIQLFSTSINKQKMIGIVSTLTGIVVWAI
jgi:hypothetical protein